MATIQIRNVPEDAYVELRRRAREQGRSLQSYLRDEVVRLARRRSKGDAVEEIRRSLAEFGGAGATPEEIVADVASGRR